MPKDLITRNLRKRFFKKIDKLDEDKLSPGLLFAQDLWLNVQEKIKLILTRLSIH